MQSSQLAIATRDLGREFLGRAILHQINLRIGFGESYGLVGSNGAGKTTLLRILAGMLSPSSGSIDIRGDEATPTSAHASQVGFLTSGMRLYAKLSVRENLEFFGKIRGMLSNQIQARLASLNRRLALARFMDTQFGLLSTGQKQRATIGCLLLHKPTILVLDEITLSLDMQAVHMVMDLLQEERARGCTLVVSTHIMEEIEGLCERVGFLHAGQLIAEGSLEEMKNKSPSGSLRDAYLRSVALTEPHSQIHSLGGAGF